jgi:hypothetical protein
MWLDRETKTVADIILADCEEGISLYVLDSIEGDATTNSNFRLKSFDVEAKQALFADCVSENEVACLDYMGTLSILSQVSATSNPHTLLEQRYSHSFASLFRRFFVRPPPSEDLLLTLQMLGYSGQLVQVTLRKPSSPPQTMGEDYKVRLDHDHRLTRFIRLRS